MNPGAVSALTAIRAVSVPVRDQDQALAFYRDRLGFTLQRDVPTPSGGRWIELAPGDGETVLTLEAMAPAVSRNAILARFSTDDAQAAWISLRRAGVAVDEILRWPGVPPMFAFRDLDGNAFSITGL